MWKGLYMGLQSGRQARMQKEAVEEDTRRWEAEMDLRERQFAAQQARQAAAAARAQSELEASLLKDAMEPWLNGGTGGRSSSGGSRSGSIDDDVASGANTALAYLSSVQTEDAETNSLVSNLSSELSQNPHKAAFFAQHVGNLEESLGRTPTLSEAQSTFTWVDDPSYYEAVSWNNGITATMQGYYKKFQEEEITAEELARESNRLQSLMRDVPSSSGGFYTTLAPTPEENRQRWKEQEDTFNRLVTREIFELPPDTEIVSTIAGHESQTAAQLQASLLTSSRDYILPYIGKFQIDGKPIGLDVYASMVSNNALGDTSLNPFFDDYRVTIGQDNLEKTTMEEVGEGESEETPIDTVVGEMPVSFQSTDEAVKSGRVRRNQQGQVEATDPTEIAFERPDGGVNIVKSESLPITSESLIGMSTMGDPLYSPGELPAVGSDRLLELEEPGLFRGLGEGEVVSGRTGNWTVVPKEITPTNLPEGVDPRTLPRSTEFTPVRHPSTEVRARDYNEGDLISYAGNIWRVENRRVGDTQNAALQFVFVREDEKDRSGPTPTETSIPSLNLSSSTRGPNQPLPPSDGVTNLGGTIGYEGDIVDQRTPGIMPLRDSADTVPTVGGPSEPSVPTAFTRLQTSLVTLLGSDSQAVRDLPRLLSETDGPRAARNVAAIIREVSALPRSSTRDKTLEVLFGLRDRLNRR